MEKEMLKIQFANAARHLLLTLLLLFMCLGTLGLMALFNTSKTGEKVTMNTPSVEISPAVKLGKKLFWDNCAQCHAKDMKTKLTGPPLFDVQKRWQDDKALYEWIAKGAVAESKTTYMNALKKSYDNLLMPRFTHLKENDVEAILAYIGTQK